MTISLRPEQVRGDPSTPPEGSALTAAWPALPDGATEMPIQLRVGKRPDQAINSIPNGVEEAPRADH